MTKSPSDRCGRDWAKDLGGSSLGVGCWAIGGPDANLGMPMGWSTACDRRSLEGLLCAFELGGRVFDTADVYGHGHSERLIGQLLRQIPRDQVVIASKVGYFAGTAPSAYHPLHIRHQLEQTLDNLGTDYLDIYFFHNFHFGIGDEYLDGAIEQMHALRSDGLIRAIGMRGPHRFATDRVTIPKERRSDKHERFREIYRRIRPEFLAVRYNMLTEDDTLFEWALQRNITIFVNKPLSQGLLTGKYDALLPSRFGPGDHRSRKRWFTPEALAVLTEGLKPIRKRFGDRPDDLVRVALRYCMRADNAVVIVGFTTPAHVEMNFKSLREPLSTEDFAFLRDALPDLRRELAALGDVFLDELSCATPDQTEGDA